MKLTKRNLDGTEAGTVEAPQQLNETVRPDLIKKAFKAARANGRQPYGAHPEAGNRHSTYLSKRRRNYRGTYGIGQSRTPRKSLNSQGRRFYWVGAEAPNTVGGRRAHAPKAEKDWTQKLNKKERRKAIRSALSAAFTDYTAEKHSVPKTYPFIVTDEFHDITKTQEAVETLQKLGFTEELERTKEKKVRAGNGTKRGRKHKTKTGLLVVLPEDATAHRALRNIPGVTTTTPNNLNVLDLAPGSHPGRLTLFTESSLQSLTDNENYL
jgi:large subunit ribosomal protein L4e